MRQVESSSETVVVFDGREERTRSTTFATDLTHAITSDQPVAANRIDALIRAGQELAGHRPLEELFTLILDLAVDSVNGERGVLLTLEGESLVPKAARGENFRISSGVRDRVLEAKESILVNDVQSDEVVSGDAQSCPTASSHADGGTPADEGRRDRPDLRRFAFVDREFSAEDLSLLTVLANVAAIRIEHAKLIELEQSRRILAKDLEQAAQIQQGLLPTQAPQGTGNRAGGTQLRLQNCRRRLLRLPAIQGWPRRHRFG